MNLRAAGLLLAACCSAGDVAAACDKRRPESTPTERFTLDGAEVYDRKTGLTWSRCSVGATWDGVRCVGDATLMGLDEAKRHARRLGKGWRLPTIGELQGIVETACRQPMINATVFPGVRELYDGKAKYWSSTPAMELPQLKYNVDFLNGEVDGNTSGIVMGVRLVRKAR